MNTDIKSGDKVLAMGPNNRFVERIIVAALDAEPLPEGLVRCKVHADDAIAELHDADKLIPVEVPKKPKAKSNEKVIKSSSTLF